MTKCACISLVSLCRIICACTIQGKVNIRFKLMITTNNIIYEENGGITLFSVHIYEKVS